MAYGGERDGEIDRLAKAYLARLGLKPQANS